MTSEMYWKKKTASPVSQSPFVVVVCAFGPHSICFARLCQVFFIHCAAAPADVHSRSDGALATEMVKDFITTYANAGF